MANKYDKKLILDYVSGNDIEDYDIDDLENDYEFMIEVINYTKDKKMYSLCSDEVKNNYMFIRFLVETFHDDFEFIAGIANEYLEKVDDNDITYKELVALVGNYAKLENASKNTYKFKIIATKLKRSELNCIKEYINEENKKIFGLGFLYIVDQYATSKILTDFFATEFIEDIFYQNESVKTDEYKRDFYKLEKLIHSNTKNREDLNDENLNNYIYKFIEPLDRALAHHIANNLYLVEELKKDLKKVYNKWDYYMKRLNNRRQIILDTEIEEFLTKYKIFVEFDIYELINYILVHLGYQPIEDEFTIYNANSEVEIVKKIRSGEELDFAEQRIVNYVTNLINDLYSKDIIDDITTDYDDYKKNDNQVINVNFGAKK